MLQEKHIYTNQHPDITPASSPSFTAINITNNNINNNNNNIKIEVNRQVMRLIMMKAWDIELNPGPSPRYSPPVYDTGMTLYCRIKTEHFMFGPHMGPFWAHMGLQGPVIGIGIGPLNLW